MKRRAYTLLEVAVATALVLFGVLVFLKVSSRSVEHAVRSEMEILSDEIFLSTLDEVLAQPYGRPGQWWLGGQAPPRRLDLPQVINSQLAPRSFQIQVCPAPEKGGNGSFFGPMPDGTRPLYDVVKIRLTWREGSEERSSGSDKERIRYVTVSRQAFDDR